MATMSAAERLRAGELAVKRRFPEKSQAVDQLIGRDENFRDMCEELADVESALNAIDRVPKELRQERLMEWGELADRLVAELDAAIGKFNVVPIDVGRHSRDHN